VLRLSLSPDSRARTILPQPGLTPFDSYEVIIRTYPGRHVIHSFVHLFGPPDTPSVVTDPSHVNIELPEGEYTVAVYAFTDGTATVAGNALAARGESAMFEIDATYVGNPITVVVALQPLWEDTEHARPGSTVGRGFGTFQWNLGPLPTNDTGRMTLMPIANDGESLEDITAGAGESFAHGTFHGITGYSIDITGGAVSGSANIPVGFYRVVIELTRAEHRNRRVTDILHVAQNMISVHNITIPDLIDLRHNVRFVNYDGSHVFDSQTPATGSYRTIRYTHASILTSPATAGDFDDLHQMLPFPGATFNAPGPQPMFHTTPHRHWMGWWTRNGYDSTTDADWGRQWLPAANSIAHLVLRDETLWARWAPLNAMIVQVIPVEMAIGMGAPPLIGSQHVYLDDIIDALVAYNLDPVANDPPDPVIFTVSDTGPAFTGFNWHTNFTGLSSTSNALTIDFANLVLSEILAGATTHYFTMEATRTGSSRPWGARVALEIRHGNGP